MGKRFFMKRSLVLTVFLLVLSFFLPNVLLAHDNKYVHPYITQEAFMVWPGVASHEIYQYLGIGFDTATGDCESAKSGSFIREGSKEEDDYDPLGDVCNIDLSLAYGYYHHFYEVDVAEPYNGLFLGDFGALSYAQVYWQSAKDFYLTNNKGTAYSYLGRIAHLLADVSVPAHVHNDPHLPLDGDSYENYIKTHYYQWDNSNVAAIEAVDPVSNYNALDELFFNLAQRAQYFPSDEVNGNTTNLNIDTISLNWPVPDNSWRKFDIFLDPYIEDSNLKIIGDYLMPRAIQYTARLYQLFWDETHGSIAGTMIDQSTGSALSGAIVNLYGPNAFIFNNQTVTDSNGSFSFSDLEHGDYYLVIYKSGYYLKTTNIFTINAGATTNIGTINLISTPNTEVTCTDVGGATTRATAFPLPLFDAPFNAEVCGDTWYSFTLKAGEGFTTTLTPHINTGRLVMYLYDPYGNGISNTGSVYNDGTGKVSYTPTVGGTYYLRVISYDGAYGNYDLAAYKAWFNAGVTDSQRSFYSTFYTARYIAPGNYQLSSYNEDYYRFTVQSGVAISITMNPHLFGGYLRIHLYDKNGSLITYKDASNGQTATINYTPTIGGIYYVWVSGRDGAYGNYDLAFSAGVNANTDSDGDGLYNAAEYYHGTDLNNPDTDGDCYSDYDEIFVGSDPLDGNSFPLDLDGDGVLDDGNNNCVVGDNPCTGGNTTNCDDNCLSTSNPDQADVDGDGLGDACDLCTDDDKDGYAVEGGICGAVDCDDNNSTINPGASELCDGLDNHCNAATPDGSGESWYGSACDGPDTDLCLEGIYQCTSGSQTCSDTTGDNVEVCDGIDNNCDGQTDEGGVCGVPDLLVSSWTAPANACAGATISIKDTTKNQGTGTAGASQTCFYFSTNPTLDTGDTKLGCRTIPSLTAGAINTGTTSVTLPNVAIGKYYLIAMADDGNVVAESNSTNTAEKNNKKTKVIYIGPDLIVSALTAPTSAVRGTTISITDTTKNKGCGTAGASTTKFYLSTNTTINIGVDYELGTRPIPALGTNAISTGTTSVVIPAGISTGKYYIIANADDAKVVVEGNETNNKKTKAITITP